MLQKQDEPSPVSWHCLNGEVGKELHFFFFFIFKLYIIVLVLPNIKMNLKGKELQ